MVGAVEAQKAEGVLHIHLFIFFQCVCQFATMQELGEMLRDRFLSADAFKHYVSTVRCAAYPEPEKFERERAHIEKTWPAYAADPSLSRLPRFFWNQPTVDAAHGLPTTTEGCNIVFPV